MTYAPTAEQRALRAATRTLLSARAGREALRDYVDHGTGYDRDLWKTMAGELGAHSINIDETYGGAGGSLADLTIVMEETGAVLWCSPFFATVVLAATALAHCDDDAAKQRILPAIAAGELTATVVHQRDSTLSAEVAPAGWKVNGSAEYVLDGDVVDVLLVVADTRSGAQMFSVEAASEGVVAVAAPVLDPTRRLATVEFANVTADLIAIDGGCETALSQVLALARVALAAEQVGGAQRCMDMAVDYAKNRHQFGRPIGSFQAVKHRCANMYVGVQSARAALLHAAWAHNERPKAFESASRLAAATASEAFYRVAAQSIQVHGGIGYTWEHDAHLYLKRAISSARLLGTPAEHRNVVALGLGLGPVSHETATAVNSPVLPDESDHGTSSWAEWLHT